jgi:hypothetical protein
MTDDRDAITPIEIEHSVDEIWDGSSLEQRYNYLDYHFELDGAYCRARAYIDDFSNVTLFGPFNQRGSISKIERPDLERAAIIYLAKRFPSVNRL